MRPGWLAVGPSALARGLRGVLGVRGLGQVAFPMGKGVQEPNGGLGFAAELSSPLGAKAQVLTPCQL